MRVTLVLVVALALLAPAECQRTRSRLQQMMQGVFDGMGSIASRITNGMTRTLGTENAGREVPVRQRQHVAKVPARQLDENSLAAPNAPQEQQQQAAGRPAVRQNRNRFSLRQFMDGTVSRLVNWLPSLRRRSSNRHRTGRDVQVSPLLRRSLYGSDTHSDDSDLIPSTAPDGIPSRAPTIHVIVNLYGEGQVEEYPQEASGTPDHSLTVTRYANHSINVQHSPSFGTMMTDDLENVTMLNNDSEEVADTTTTTTEPSDTEYVMYAFGDENSLPNGTFPSVEEFINNFGPSHWWGQKLSHRPQESYDTPTVDKDNSTGNDNFDLFTSHSVNYQIPVISNSPKVVTSRELSSEITGYKHGFLKGYDSGFVDGTTRASLERYQYGNGSSNNNKGGPDNRHSVNTNARWSPGTNTRGQVGSVNGQGSQNTNQLQVRGGAAGCGVSCLWGDLMNILDHYSTSESTENSRAKASAGSVGHAVLSERVQQSSPNTQHDTYPGNSFPPNNNVYTHSLTNRVHRPGINNINTAFGRRPPQYQHNFHPLNSGVTSQPRVNRRPPSPSWDQTDDQEVLPPGPPYSSSPAIFRPDYDQNRAAGRVVSWVAGQDQGVGRLSNFHNGGLRRRWDG
ncbi:uncharacterized protein LOC121877089 [Homarus americanus]|uniref:uncharacterized protein LOC121877089 n=1 Tax=Homarus americanus TaxID=6706 RepID=UPI001C4436D1|nr:uncharacterized protein LOC121877089 [Homarus americanus]